MNEDVWQVPPKSLRLPDKVVDVWYVPLHQPKTVRHQLAQLLAPDERQRAAQFHFARDRHHYTVGRGVLRTLVGRYLRQAPEAVQFQYGARGKPAVASVHERPRLDFNLSHSHERAVYAFAWERELGIDIEYLRPLDDAQAIAEQFFSQREYQQLCTLPQADRHRAFFTCWTRKEAYIKAGGDGLAYPLDRFAVSCVPEDTTPRLEVYGHPRETQRWSVHALPTDAAYVAALVVEGHEWQRRCWRWLPTSFL